MTKKQLDKMLAASALKQAQILNESQPSQEVLSGISISPSFDKKMSQLIGQAKISHKTKILKAVASLVICIGIAGVSLYASAVHPDLFHVFQRSYSITPENSKSAEQDFNSRILADVSNAYLPNWMPEGFVADHVSNSKSGNSLINYSNIRDKKQFVLISQKVTTVKILDDSDIKGFKKITIANQIYYFGEKNLSGSAQSNLVFLYENRYFLITSTTGETDLIKIAQSLKFKA